MSVPGFEYFLVNRIKTKYLFYIHKTPYRFTFSICNKITSYTSRIKIKGNVFSDYVIERIYSDGNHMKRRICKKEIIDENDYCEEKVHVSALYVIL